MTMPANFVLRQGRKRVMDTGIRTDRIETIREIVSGLLEQVPDASLRASG
jgi:hypothetical protein